MLDEKKPRHLLGIGHLEDIELIVNKAWIRLIARCRRITRGAGSRSRAAAALTSGRRTVG